MSKVNIISIACVWEANALLGEGVLYDPRNQHILWLDIKGEKIFSYDTQTGEQESWSLPGQLSALGLRKAGGYICVLKNGFHFLEFKPHPSLTFINDPEGNKTLNRFNDGAVDPFGGFWAGTIDDGETDETAGKWWRLGPNREVSVLDDRFHVTNGPVFDSARGYVYYTDSARQTIYRARFQSNGTISQKSSFITFGEGHGYPDGMAIDSDGILWVAFWDGACLRRISAEGEILQKIDMPVPRPTKVAISGNDVFVSSASIGLQSRDLDKAPLSGGLFHIKLSESIEASCYYFSG